MMAMPRRMLVAVIGIGRNNLQGEGRGRRLKHGRNLESRAGRDNPEERTLRCRMLPSEPPPFKERVNELGSDGGQLAREQEYGPEALEQADRRRSPPHQRQA